MGAQPKQHLWQAAGAHAGLNNPGVSWWECVTVRREGLVKRNAAIKVGGNRADNGGERPATQVLPDEAKAFLKWQTGGRDLCELIVEGREIVAGENG
jgi:hypothetical protein